MAIEIKITGDGGVFQIETNLPGPQHLKKALLAAIDSVEKAALEAEARAAATTTAATVQPATAEDLRSAELRSALADRWRGRSPNGG